MCGINVLIKTIGNLNSSDIDLIPKLLLNTEHRGKDATGAALISSSNNVFSVFKIGKSATETTNSEEFKQFLNEKTEAVKPNIAILHNRAATRGAAANNENNHPLFNENIVLAHNGIISNYDAIREVLEAKGLKFNAEVDTEALLKTLEHTQSIKRTYTLLTGSFAFAAFANKTLYAVRYGNPLIMAYFPRRNLIIISSEKDIIKKTVNAVKTKHFNVFIEYGNSEKVFYVELKDSSYAKISFNPLKIKIKELHINDNEPLNEEVTKATAKHKEALKPISYNGYSGNYGLLDYEEAEDEKLQKEINKGYKYGYLW